MKAINSKTQWVCLNLIKDLQKILEERKRGLIELMHNYLSDRKVIYESGNLHKLQKSCPQVVILCPFFGLLILMIFLKWN